MDREQLRLYIPNDSNDAMIRNFVEQEKMAKITGQNVRERIRAQMEAKEIPICKPNGICQHHN